MPEETPIEGSTILVEMLGRFVDILDLDPTRYGQAKNWKGLRLVEWKKGQARQGVEVPPELANNFTPGQYGQRDSQGIVINDASTFQDTLTSKFNLSAGAEGIFTASRTETATTDITNKLNKDQELMLTRAWGEGPRLTMPIPIPESFVFTDQFKGLVRDLPTDGDEGNTVSRYEQFINRVGTHFVSEVTLGGYACQYTRVDKTTTAHRQTSEQELKLAAELKFKISAGIDIEQSRRQLAELERTVKISSDSIQWSGGKPQADLIEWIHSLDEKPSIAECRLTPVTKLLTSQYFKSDSSRDVKRGHLAKLIIHHIETQGRDTGVILGNLPVAIQNWGGRYALAIVGDSLRFVLADIMDQRQRWVFDGPPKQYIMSVARRERPSSGYGIRNMDTNHYLKKGQDEGELLSAIAITRDKSEALQWRPYIAPAQLSIPLERPVRHIERVQLITHTGDRVWSLGSNFLGNNFAKLGAGVSPTPGAGNLRISRRYDALAEFD
jgi:MAC/Perforin domain